MRAVIIRDVCPAVDALKAGKVVAIPTETVYGLAANALSADACSRIYEAKKRPSDNPLIVHVSSIDQLAEVIEPTLYADAFGSLGASLDSTDQILVDRLKAATKRFWPGPLTLVVPRNPLIPDIVIGGSSGGNTIDTVAVRMPSHPIAREIIQECGFPLAAPSANLSGRPSPTTAEHVFEDLSDRIELIVDGGPCNLGVESTVLDLTRPAPTILRPGSITLSQLQVFLPDTCLYEHTEQHRDNAWRPSTPGLKYRHYAPSAPVKLCFSVEEADDFIKSKRGSNLIVHLGYFSLEESTDDNNVAKLALAPNPYDFAKIASNLFAVLRKADSMNPDWIVAEACPEQEEGLAVMNRLRKAASSNACLAPETVSK